MEVKSKSISLSFLLIFQICTVMKMTKPPVFVIYLKFIYFELA